MPRTDGACFVLLLLLIFQCVHSFIKSVLIDDLSYRIVRVSKSSNNTIFQGGNVAIYTSEWCVATTENDDIRKLLPKSKNIIKGVDKNLGSFSGIKVEWECTLDNSRVLPIKTTIKNYDSGKAILFEMELPEGAPVGTMSSRDESFTNFPLFLLPSDNSSVLSSALSWEGSFVQAVRGYSSGPTGGPTLFYDANDPDLATVIIGSPYGIEGQFKTFTAGNNKDWKGRKAWSPGTSSRLSSVPPGFKQTFIIYEGRGITETLFQWGEIMKQASSAHGRKIRDVTLEKIGYQTDNGAYYCFCQYKNCSQVLIQEIESTRSIGIPMGYLSFQGAGASSGRGEAAPWCVDVWGVDGGLSPNYPLPLDEFQQAIDIPLQLYAPYFCPTSPYFSKTESLTWDYVSSNPNLTECDSFNFITIDAENSRKFYGWFFDKGTRVKMTSFEIDFMNQNYNCVPEFHQSSSAGDQWLSGIADAALERNISVQLCFATPSDVLASTNMPAITQFRVSFDFCYGKSWDIGDSSLIVWALGSAPSKDTLWTSDNSHTETPGCKWTVDHENSAAELHLVLALMSTGPVGISDGINMTNATLLKKAIRKDGTLLKPSKPITSVDSIFLNPSAGGRNGLDGNLLGTSSVGYSWIFVAFNILTSYVIRFGDFWPRLSPSKMVAFRTQDSERCINGLDAVESQCIELANLNTTCFNLSQTMEFQQAPNFIPSITYFWQPCKESKWLLLGELDKYVPLSKNRFEKVECTDTGLFMILLGSFDEVVTITLLEPIVINNSTRYFIINENVTFPVSGNARLSFGKLFSDIK